MKLTTEATHILESQGQALSVASKCGSPWKPPTCWRAKGRHHQQGPNPAHHGSHSPTGEPRTAIISRAQVQLTTEATHFLEGRGQALSAVQIQLTTKATHQLESHQQCPNPAHHRNHSLTGEPRIGIISGLYAAWHASYSLSGQASSAGLKGRKGQ